VTLQQLTYFLAALEHGSFSAAADSLHMAQPSLSEQVRRLEKELGVPLFVRAGRGLQPTEAGLELRTYAERMLGLADEARASVGEIRELRGGTASFGMFGDAPWYGLTDLVAAFRARFPDVRLRVVGQNSYEVADAVRSGELEAGLIVLPVDDTGLDVRPVMRDEVLYASAERKRTRAPLTVEELVERPLVLYDARFGWSDPTRSLLYERAQARGLRIEPVVEVEHLLAALDLVARGVGDTIVDEIVTLADGYPEGLHVTTFAEPLHNTFAFITRHGAQLSPATREVVSLAQTLVVDMVRKLTRAQSRRGSRRR
jgi:DNA-binding transcriptional LysR family regulator